MAAKNTYELETFRPSRRRTRKPANTKVFIIAAACVLVAAFAVSALLLLGNGKAAARIVDFGTVLKGVSVGGIDLSGMTKEQALEATAQLEPDLLATVDISLDVAGQTLKYSAADFNVTTDYQYIMDKALSYGHTGAFEQREAEAKAALSEGVSYDIKLVMEESTLSARLAELKTEFDTMPGDATATFAPWGYTAGADGTYAPYAPDLETIKAMCNAYANSKTYERPELVRTPESEMPLAIRYEYWKKKGSTVESVKDFRPADANISRFIYTPEVTGIVTDTDAIKDDILAQIASGSFAAISVPTEVTEPAVKLADVKANTQMIASWTSYWGGSHYGYERNYNVSMISSLINGNLLQPGVEWSINKTIGDRNAQTAKKYGWQKAAGIENGGYTPQYGGGVCQLGSTTYNAAIRSGITIIKSKHHSIPSDYVPLGLDATLSSGDLLDLILKNDNTTPYYLVSYINPEENYVTVEVYGPKLVDPRFSGQDIIYTYISKKIGSYGTPVPETIYCTVPTTAPDGTVIDGVTCTSYEYAKNRQGTSVETYRHILALDGTPLLEEAFKPYKYPVINGTVYIWGADPALVPPVDPNAPAAPTVPAATTP